MRSAGQPGQRTWVRLTDSSSEQTTVGPAVWAQSPLAFVVMFSAGPLAEIIGGLLAQWFARRFAGARLPMNEN